MPPAAGEQAGGAAAGSHAGAYEELQNFLMRDQSSEDGASVPFYASRFMANPAPKARLPAESMPPAIAAQVIRDELTLDGAPGLNLATFVSTYMEEEATKLLAEQMRKNQIDADEYPMTAEIQDRCVRILADLYHAPQPFDGVGTSCVGSSEGCLLAGFAMKILWQQRMRARHGGQELRARPNIIMPTSVQIVWRKFVVLADVEARFVPLKKDCYTMTPEDVASRIDENTIGVIALFASTLTGEYDPIADIAAAVEGVNQAKGLDVGIHVDAASGGYVAPFLTPDLVWDFRLPLVRSINVSTHKYGLVYAGIGFVLWREARFLPEDMIFSINYLGSKECTIGLNFSRSAMGLIGAYYNVIRLGVQGYTTIMQNLARIRDFIRDGLTRTGHFQSVQHSPGVPVVCVRLADGVGAVDGGSFTVFDVSERLREHGWIVPAYTLADDAADVAVLRIVVREGLSADLAYKLVADVNAVVDKLRADAQARQHGGENVRC